MGAATDDELTVPDVRIPAFPPGGTPEELLDALDRWVRSDAMARLAAASGWPAPAGSLRDVVVELSGRSADWDFRPRLRPERNPERHGLAEIDAEVNGTVLDEAMIEQAATELGLAGARAVTGPFTHVVVLGGMALACLKRSREADRWREALVIPHVVVLTAHRPLAGKEPEQAREQGWGDLALESQAASAAAHAVFGTPAATDGEEVWWDGDGTDVPAGLDPDEWRRRKSWSHTRGELPGFALDVVAAPSGDPADHRTNTYDQLAFWAERAGLTASDSLLLVTTEHYVPAQHLHGIRAVGLPRGCGVETCGVEWVPAAPKTGEPRKGAGYLQEVRSALLAAALLLDTITN